MLEKHLKMKCVTSQTINEAFIIQLNMKDTIAKTISPEDKFKELIEGLTIHFDEKHPDSTFFMRDGKVVFELNKLFLYIDYPTFWGIFVNEYSMQYDDIQTFIKTMVEKHLKMKDVKAEHLP